MAQRRGSIHTRDGKLYARLTWTKTDGRRASREKQVTKKTEGWRLIDGWLREIEHHGEKAADINNLTFDRLADHVRDNYFVAPVIRNGRRVSGCNSWQDRRGKLEICREYFGRRRLRSITAGDVEKFKRERLNTPTWRGDERTIATVNRELATLRRALSIAQAEGWIVKNPFEGRGLIEVAHEVKRDRILTPEEEARLLAACTGKRAHLKPIILCALDTGMRQGEIFTLIISDVDPAARMISIRSTNTKTQQARQVPITRRLLSHLEGLLRHREPDELVFGIEDSVKRSFASACRDAGIAGLRFHDLRHTAATRWIQVGLPVPVVAKLLGHSSIQTTMRYVNPTPAMLSEALSIFDSSHPDSHDGPNEDEQEKGKAG